jgi:hypothetical protein
VEPVLITLAAHDAVLWRAAVETARPQAKRLTAPRAGAPTARCAMLAWRAERMGWAA